MAQALLPLKDLVQAKTRLAGLLSPSERRALAQSMAEDVLEVLAGHPEIHRTTLVSDDPGAHLLAARYGAGFWPESLLACRGLNAIAARASQRLLVLGEQPLLLLHGDLPLLRREDISAVIECQRRCGGLVIGCDHRGTGTNLLAFDAGSVPPFCFGAGSCERHAAGAKRAGIPARVLCRRGIALDVDEPGDLGRLLRALAPACGSHTAKLLQETALGRRIELALADPGHGELKGELCG